MFHVRVTLDGSPLRYAFVSHQPDFADPIFVLTNDDGEAQFAEVKATAKIDIVVHAHNLAVRMLDGTKTSSVEKSLVYRNKASGSRLNVSRRDKSFEYYDVMARCYEAYDVVFRPIAPFSAPSRRSFPFGGTSKSVHELKRAPAVDCRYPEKIAPGKLPWVQPQSVTGGRPLMHVKAQSTDRRLFGTATRPATTIPHEFAHAVHFAMLSTTNRWKVAIKYGIWIAKELSNGRAGTHRTDKRTAPLIAYIESIGIFAQRFYLFSTVVRPELSGARLRAAFVEDELSAEPALTELLPGYVKIATRAASGGIKPHLTGSSTEGAIYGAIFLDLASRVSLADAVKMYLRCGASDIAGYLAYASKQQRGSLRSELNAVKKTWKL